MVPYKAAYLWLCTLSIGGLVSTEATVQVSCFTDVSTKLPFYENKFEFFCNSRYPPRHYQSTVLWNYGCYINKIKLLYKDIFSCLSIF